MSSLGQKEGKLFKSNWQFTNATIFSLCNCKLLLKKQSVFQHQPTCTTQSAESPIKDPKNPGSIANSEAPLDFKPRQETSSAGKQPTFLTADFDVYF